MRFQDLNPFKRKSEDETKSLAKTGLTPMEVWKSPVDFNRAIRRWAGLTGRVWKWNPQTPVAPRYVRRHYDITKFTTPKTRRQRRHRARILRAMQVGVPKP